MHPSAEFDVVVWAQLLCNAVLAGFDWLEIKRADSHVWNCFINLLLQHHLPYTEDHDLKGDVCELPLYTSHASAIQYGGISLKLMDTRDSAQSTTPMRLDDAIRHFMCPSLSALMYRVAFRKYDKGESDWTAHCWAISGSQPPVVNVPNDTQLRLALIQSPYTQQTSFSSPETPSYADESMVGHAISCIRQRVGLNNIYFVDIPHDTAVLQATFFALKSIISSDAFEVNGPLLLQGSCRLFSAQ